MTRCPSRRRRDLVAALIAISEGRPCPCSMTRGSPRCDRGPDRAGRGVRTRFGRRVVMRSLLRAPGSPCPTPRTEIDGLPARRSPRRAASGRSTSSTCSGARTSASARARGGRGRCPCLWLQLGIANEGRRIRRRRAVVMDRHDRRAAARRGATPRVGGRPGVPGAPPGHPLAAAVLAAASCGTGLTPEPTVAPTPLPSIPDRLAPAVGAIARSESVGPRRITSRTARREGRPVPALIVTPADGPPP
jgi:hypothetical protein